ncbi:hypothetical protein FJZ26_02935 [Candidatus Parvarchaeota archaeon]|nr:hypothetical protein [Candidatus Parvarchaeota archaeon]
MGASTQIKKVTGFVISEEEVQGTKVKVIRPAKAILKKTILEGKEVLLVRDKKKSRRIKSRPDIVVTDKRPQRKITVNKEKKGGQEGKKKDEKELESKSSVGFRKVTKQGKADAQFNLGLLDEKVLDALKKGFATCELGEERNEPGLVIHYLFTTLNPADFQTTAGNKFRRGLPFMNMLIAYLSDRERFSRLASAAKSGQEL